MTNETLPAALAGQVERGVRPLAIRLAQRLQAAAYSHGYEDAHPSNATTRQAMTDRVSRQTLVDLLIAMAVMGNKADEMQSLADSEGTRAIEYLRRAWKAEAALRELVALEDLKGRLRKLHEMGHGTDYGDYHQREPLAWTQARCVLGPNV